MKMITHDTTMINMTTFKKEAKAYNKETGCSYAHALNQVSREHGFKNWNTARPAIEKNDKEKEYSCITFHFGRNFGTTSDFDSIFNKIENTVFTQISDRSLPYDPMADYVFDFDKEYLNNDFYKKDKKRELPLIGGTVFDLVSIFKHTSEERKFSPDEERLRPSHLGDNSFYEQAGKLYPDDKKTPLDYLKGNAVFSFSGFDAKPPLLALLVLPSFRDYFNNYDFEVSLCLGGLNVVFHYSSPQYFLYDLLSFYHSKKFRVFFDLRQVIVEALSYLDVHEQKKIKQQRQLNEDKRQHEIKLKKIKEDRKREAEGTTN